MLSLLKSPTPLFKRVSPSNLFFKPPLFCQVVFPPRFFSPKKKRQKSPRTTWWIAQYTSLPPRDESFLRVADTLGLGLVEIAEPKRGWVMNLGSWWKVWWLGLGEVGWGWGGGVYTFDNLELWSFHGVDCLRMRDLGNKKKVCAKLLFLSKSFQIGLDENEKIQH